MANVLKITIQLGDNPNAVMTFKGRYAWTLHNLIEAGKRGCTPIENPAPRWSHYVMILRRAGIAIETIEEAHGGAYKGFHGRYVLRVQLTVLAVKKAP